MVHCAMVSCLWCDCGRDRSCLHRLGVIGSELVQPGRSIESNVSWSWTRIETWPIQIRCRYKILLCQMPAARSSRIVRWWQNKKSSSRGYRNYHLLWVVHGRPIRFEFEANRHIRRLLLHFAFCIPCKLVGHFQLGCGIDCKDAYPATLENKKYEWKYRKKPYWTRTALNGVLAKVLNEKVGER